MTEVFVGIKSPAQLWEQRVPKGEDQLELRIKKEMRDRPVLRNITQLLGVSTDVLTVENFDYHFNRILTCSHQRRRQYVCLPYFTPPLPIYLSGINLGKLTLFPLYRDIHTWTA